MNQIKNLLTARARNEQVSSEHLDVEFQNGFSLSSFMLEIDQQVPHTKMREEAGGTKRASKPSERFLLVA